MGWKCAPQVMGLVKGEPRPGQKHRANGSKIAKEAGYERATLSATYDKSRAHLNSYEGYKSGKVFWEDMEAEASEYRVQVHRKNRDGKDEVHERTLREDAVIGFAIIFNPPAEVCDDWSEEDYKKFFSDAEACMAEIEPRLFRQENIRMCARHRDEGIPPEDKKDAVIDEHEHVLGVCKDQEGHYCGNLIDAKLLDKINREFPRLMRERGWKEMDDLDVTDWKKAKKELEYRKERNAHRRKNGRSVNVYTAQKLQKKIQSLESAIETAEEMKKQAETHEKDAEKKASGIIKKAESDAAKIVTAGKRKSQKMSDDVSEKLDKYTQSLFTILERVHSRNDSDEEILDEYESFEDLTDAVIQEFDILEDYLYDESEEKIREAEAKSREADAKSKEAEQARNEYENTKNEVSRNIANGISPNPRKSIDDMLDMIKIIQERVTDKRIKDAAQIMHKLISTDRNSNAAILQSWQEDRAKKQYSQLQDIEDRLRDNLQNHKDKEYQ